MKPVWARSNPRMTLLYRIVLFLAYCFFKLLYRHRVYGHEHFYAGAALIAANHVSFYDPPLLSLSWPQEVHFLARRSLFKNPLFGWLIRNLNTHPLSGGASNAGVFKAVLQLLSHGNKVVLFPEGKRSFTGELQAFKPGFSLLVARSHTAVIPAYIHGSFSIWGRGRAFPKLWGKTACVFGTPLLWSDLMHLGSEKGQAELSRRLAAAIEALRKWYEEGARGTPP